VKKLIDEYGSQGMTMGKFSKSLVRLDPTGNYEYALNRYYQSCLDYGFTIKNVSQQMLSHIKWYSGSGLRYVDHGRHNKNTNEPIG
jgi:hypothetical protein